MTKLNSADITLLVFSVTWFRNYWFGAQKTFLINNIENFLGYSRNPCSLNRKRDAAWAFHALGMPLGVPIVWSPYRITPIHWLMVRRCPWRTYVVSLYWRTRHLLLSRKEPCRQREELGRKCCVSFPIQRTRVTRVTRDVLYHRFT